jgi:hypothetical protein
MTKKKRKLSSLLATSPAENQLRQMRLDRQRDVLKHRAEEMGVAPAVLTRAIELWEGGAHLATALALIDRAMQEFNKTLHIRRFLRAQGVWPAHLAIKRSRTKDFYIITAPVAWNNDDGIEYSEVEWQRLCQATLGTNLRPDHPRWSLPTESAQWWADWEQQHAAHYFAQDMLRAYEKGLRQKRYPAVTATARPVEIAPLQLVVVTHCAPVKNDDGDPDCA